jgi:hypothetical protein
VHLKLPDETVRTSVRKRSRRVVETDERCRIGE